MRFASGPSSVIFSTVGAHAAGSWISAIQRPCSTLSFTGHPPTERPPSAASASCITLILIFRLHRKVVVSKSLSPIAQLRKLLIYITALLGFTLTWFVGARVLAQGFCDNTYDFVDHLVGRLPLFLKGRGFVFLCCDLLLHVREAELDPDLVVRDDALIHAQLNESDQAWEDDALDFATMEN